MPELPEVETVKRGLDEGHVVYKKITNVQVFEPKLIDKPNDLATFIDRVTGSTIYEINRYGKFARLTLIKEDAEPTMFLVHLGMTGALMLFKDASEIPLEYKNHLHAQFDLDNGKHLFYCDIRKFGSLRAVTGEEYNELPIAEYGPDALAYNINTEFIKNVRETKEDKNGNPISIYGDRPIKQVLMEQKVIAGIGNIYANETLFLMGINPHTLCKDLTDEQLREIVGTNRAIMEMSIEFGGCSFSDYVNAYGKKGEYQNYLRVYDREGEDCLAECGDKIVKSMIDKRATYHCPTCQPAV